MVERNCCRALVSGLVLGVAVASCQNPQAIGGPPDHWTSAAPAPIIYHNKNSDGTITSYQAEVEVYSQNNRRVGVPRLVQKYKMSAKIIEGKVYTRLDARADSAQDKKAKAYISDGKQMVVVDPVTLRVYARANLAQPAGQLQDLGTAQTKTLFGKVPLTEWKAQFQKLNFEITEDKANNRLGVTIPAKLLLNAQLPGFSIQRARLLYDTAEETPAGIEMAVTTADGQTQTYVTQPVYAEKDGVPVKVADVTMVVDSAQHLGPEEAAYDYAIPEASIGDIPVVTEADLAQMESDGAQITYVDPVVTPANPDSPDSTLITTYDQIHLNDVDDSFFKMAF